MPHDNDFKESMNDDGVAAEKTSPDSKPLLFFLEFNPDRPLQDQVKIGREQKAYVQLCVRKDYLKTPETAAELRQLFQIKAFLDSDTTKDIKSEYHELTTPDTRDRDKSGEYVVILDMEFWADPNKMGKYRLRFHLLSDSEMMGSLASDWFLIKPDYMLFVHQKGNSNPNWKPFVQIGSDLDGRQKVKVYLRALDSGPAKSIFWVGRNAAKLVVRPILARVLPDGTEKLFPLPEEMNCKLRETTIGKNREYYNIGRAELDVPTDVLKEEEDLTISGARYTFKFELLKDSEIFDGSITEEVQPTFRIIKK